MTEESAEHIFLVIGIKAGTIVGMFPGVCDGIIFINIVDKGFAVKIVVISIDLLTDELTAVFLPVFIGTIGGDDIFFGADGITDLAGIPGIIKRPGADRRITVS